MDGILTFSEKDQIDWKDVLRDLENLTKECQTEEGRNALNVLNFKEVERILALVQHEKVVRDEIFVEAFRFLRNSVVNSSRNQNAIRNDTDLLQVVPSYLRLEVDIDKDLTSNMSKVVTARCALQFFANVMVENPFNGTIIAAIFSNEIAPLVQCYRNDEKIIQFISMIIQQAIKHAPEKIKLGPAILQILLENMHLEFVVFAMECIVVQSNFIVSIYEDLEPKYRVKLLCFLNERQDLLTLMDSMTVIFLKDDFIARSDFILKSQLKDKDDAFCWQISVLLEFLCLISAKGSENLNLHTSLLTTVLYLLRQVHDAGKNSNETDNVFCLVEDLKKLTSQSTEQSNIDHDDIRAHPTFQFKAHLIRLIGNLAYKNKENQEKVRELGCLPVILDSCKIDARNPFITQWSVLAIRNLCEGNEENQAFIREIQRVDTENLLPKLELIGL